MTTCVYVTLLPAATDVADGEFVVTRSACVAVATTSAAVALLFGKVWIGDRGSDSRRFVDRSARKSRLTFTFTT